MPDPSISLVMPTIAWDPTFRRCLAAALQGLQAGDQCLVVFDGLAPAAPAWLSHSPVELLSTGLRRGPAAARNLAAARARCPWLLFVDADVELHPDAIERLRLRLQQQPSLTALFGSYDDRPAAPGVVSRFRNLLHHHTHHGHAGPATSFWAGCGAVRREAFAAVAGFDAERYPLPSIEDIELGLRLSDRGGAILLDPAIQGTHHKRWTLRTMLLTDIRQRAVPWSRLLLQRRELPATLNLSLAARISAAASLLLLVASPLAVLLPALRTAGLGLAALCLALLLALNHALYRLLFRRGGWRVGCAGIALHLIYLSTSSLTFLAMALDHWCRRRADR
ncbi:MAG: glycosyltransferase family 2 protein [Synechococcaceae cyanobacterium]|nr:glycosyltransferase family 2 protein [Synechococcaceae cyanobacterium]